MSKRHSYVVKDRIKELLADVESRIMGNEQIMGSVVADLRSLGDLETPGKKEMAIKANRMAEVIMRDRMERAALLRAAIELGPLTKIDFDDPLDTEIPVTA